MILFEGVHPLEGGALRLKFRRDRRHGMPRENPLLFYPRFAAETLVQDLALLEGLPAPARRSSTRCWQRPTAGPTPISRSRRRRPTSSTRSSIYHATRGGEDALARKHRDDAIRGGSSHAGRRRRIAQRHQASTPDINIDMIV